MSGLFRRKKGTRKGKAQEDEEDGFLDLIAMKVNDADGNHFGEVVSADKEGYVIKHQGTFYRFPLENIHNKYGDLMLTSNTDLNLARKRGEQWKDPGKDIIRENKFYDFSEKKRLEEERNERILLEMEKVRELAVRTMQPEIEDKNEDEDEEIEPGEEEHGRDEPEEGSQVDGAAVEGAEEEIIEENDGGEVEENAQTENDGDEEEIIEENDVEADKNKEEIDEEEE